MRRGRRTWRRRRRSPRPTCSGMGVIDGIIPEPAGGARRHHAEVMASTARPSPSSSAISRALGATGGPGTQARQIPRHRHQFELIGCPSSGHEANSKRAVNHRRLPHGNRPLVTRSFGQQVFRVADFWAERSVPSFCWRRRCRGCAARRLRRPEAAGNAKAMAPLEAGDVSRLAGRRLVARTRR